MPKISAMRTALLLPLSCRGREKKSGLKLYCKSQACARCPEMGNGAFMLGVEVMPKDVYFPVFG